MNSSRRGAVHGFKLESLVKIVDIKSCDRKQTLLNYITHVTEKVFPNVLTFYEDLDIHSACSGRCDFCCVMVMVVVMMVVVVMVVVVVRV